MEWESGDGVETGLDEALGECRLHRHKNVEKNIYTISSNHIYWQQKEFIIFYTINSHLYLSQIFFLTIQGK